MAGRRWVELSGVLGRNWSLPGAFLAAAMLLLSGCVQEKAPAPAPTPGMGTAASGAPASHGNMNPNAGGPPAASPAAASLSGKISLDGSSTVFVLSQAVAEAFRESATSVDITIGRSGTGGGFKKFVLGETDISNASRPIKSKESDEAKKNGIEYLELAVAIDGLSVCVNPQNDWLSCLSVAQLKKIWDKGSTVQKWSDIDPSYPDQPIKLYGPGTDSGTFDYFTEVINGEARRCRDDYTPSENDNVLVEGIAGNKYALGYFGYAYYAENQSKLKVIPIKATDDGECITPSQETIHAGTYVPLARPLFVYINLAALKRPEVAAFVKYYLGEGQKAVTEIKYFPLAPETLKEMQSRLTQALGG